MLREFFLFLSRASWAQAAITHFPPSRRMARRFVAGSTIEETLPTLKTLNQQGMHATVDFLGESVATADEARKASDEYLRALVQIAEHGVRANVSLKLTQFGLDIDHALCVENVLRVVEKARACGTFVRIDMEGTPHTDRTLAVVDALRRSHDWVGTVLQAYLYRTEQDCRDLAYEGSRIRLCKGAYKEPESVAFQAKEDVDKAYVRCMRILFDSPCYPMIASHDPRLVEIAGALATRADRAKGTYEHQMLYGVRPDEQRRLAKAGERMRVYIPYGAEWYGYMVRRMAEKPANMALFVKSMTSKS